MDRVPTSIRQKNPDASRSDYLWTRRSALVIMDQISGSEGPAGGASSGGNYGGNQNTGGGDNNQGSDQGHSRFDVGSGYYGEEVTDRGESGDTKNQKQ